MQSNKLEDLIIESIVKKFGKAAKDFTVKTSTDTPYILVEVEMTLYNFYVVKVSVERNTIFASIVQSNFLLELFKTQVSELENGTILKKLDEEVRLRIPEKYLLNKGWN